MACSNLAKLNCDYLTVPAPIDLLGGGATMAFR